MPSSLPQIYDVNGRDARFIECFKYLLQRASLATAAVATAVGTGAVLSNNYDELFIRNCLIATTAGLAVRLYASSFGILRPEDEKKSGLRQLIEFL